MSKTVAVDCMIDQEGRVHVRRIQLDDRWLAVEQGRQWIDENGRHVLVKTPGRDVQEILLSSHSLQWELVPRQAGSQIV